MCYCNPMLCLLIYGAEGETRTPTPLRELDPEPSVSTNSTTSARRCVYANRGWLASIFFDFRKKIHGNGADIFDLSKKLA